MMCTCIGDTKTACFTGCLGIALVIVKVNLFKTKRFFVVVDCCLVTRYLRNGTVIPREAQFLRFQGDIGIGHFRYIKILTWRRGLAE